MDTHNMPIMPQNPPETSGSIPEGGAQKQAHDAQMQAELRAEMERQSRALEIQRAQEEAHKCKVCHKPFSTGQQLLQHQLVHNDVRRFPCKYCDKRFKQMSHLQQHHRRHTGDRPYKCEVEECGKAFMQLAHLQQHQRNHIGRTRPYNKLHPCEICDRSFSTQSALNVHISELHVGTMVGKDRKCETCCRYFSSVELYLKHMYKIHPEDYNEISGGRPLDFFLGPQEVKHQEKVFKCTHCDKRFSQKTGLTKHMATHPERADLLAQLFSCPVLACKKVFTRESYLTRHLETNPDDDHMKAWEEQMKLSPPPSAAKGTPSNIMPSTSEDANLSPIEDLDMEAEANEGSSTRCRTRSSTRRQRIRHRVQIMQNQKAALDSKEQLAPAPDGDKKTEQQGEQPAMDLPSTGLTPASHGPPVFPTPAIDTDQPVSPPTSAPQNTPPDSTEQKESADPQSNSHAESSPPPSADVQKEIPEQKPDIPVSQAGNALIANVGPNVPAAGPSQPSPPTGKAASGFPASNNSSSEMGYYLQPL